VRVRVSERAGAGQGGSRAGGAAFNRSIVQSVIPQREKRCALSVLSPAGENRKRHQARRRGGRKSSRESLSAATGRPIAVRDESES
jgi:hypothetical protein